VTFHGDGRLIAFFTRYTRVTSKTRKLFHAADIGALGEILAKSEAARSSASVNLRTGNPMITPDSLPVEDGGSDEVE
jgi:hypothetical protein